MISLVEKLILDFLYRRRWNCRYV